MVTTPFATRDNETKRDEPFNRAALVDQVGGDPTVLVELITLFLDEYPACLVKLRDAVQSQDGRRLKQAAHHLGGTLGHFSAVAAMQLARRLERAGQSGDLAGMDAVLDSLEREGELLQGALRSLAHEAPRLFAEAPDEEPPPPRPAPTADVAPTVLVVDDSAVDRRLAGNVVERVCELKAVYAADGEEALELIRREPPTVVLTDLQMPKRDGLQLVEAVRANWPAVPVILMTAVGSEDAAAAALQHGAVSYVPKRHLTRDLPDTLKRVLASAKVKRSEQVLLDCITELDCRFVLGNDSVLVKPLVTYLQEHLVRLRLCDEHDVMRLGIALEEAVINGMRHGNLELDSALRERDDNAYLELGRQRNRQAPYRDRRVHVRLQLNTHQAVMIVRDEGPGFDPSKVADPTDPENMVKSSGRGLMLIRTFLDEVTHNARGNQITMVKRRAQSSSPAMRPR